MINKVTVSFAQKIEADNRPFTLVLFCSLDDFEQGGSHFDQLLIVKRVTSKSYVVDDYS